MKKEDLTIITIKDEDIFVAWIKLIPGLVVQVDKKEDIPIELSKSMEVLIKYQFESGNYIEKEFNIDE
jgi:hypothetical protein